MFICFLKSFTLVIFLKKGFYFLKYQTFFVRYSLSVYYAFVVFLKCGCELPIFKLLRTKKSNIKFATTVASNVFMANQAGSLAPPSAKGNSLSWFLVNCTSL